MRFLIIRNHKFSDLLYLAIVVVAIGIASPHFLSLVEALGHNIPQEDIGNDYVIAILWASILGISIFFWPVSPTDKKYLLRAWKVKLIVVLGLMLFYENYYGLDAFGYFGLSKVDAEGGPDSLGTKEIVVNIAKLHQFIYIDSYHAIKVSFAMFGLIGIYLFYRSSVIILNKENSKIFYVLAFFPGILFWSSILGKDPIVFLGIAIYVYGVVGLCKLNNKRYLVFIATGVIISSMIRQWLGPIMFLPLVILLINGLRGIGSKIVLMTFTAIAVKLSVGPFMERFKVEAFEDLLTATDKTARGFISDTGGSTQQLNVDFTSIGGILSFLPYGAFSVLFRPLPGEVMNPFGLVAGLESALLIVLLVFSIKRTRIRELKEPLVMWAILFIVLWASVNGIIASTNFGLSVRYRLQILPVLLGLLLYLSRKRQKHGVVKGKVPIVCAAKS